MGAIRVIPEAGNDFLDADAAKAKSSTFLFEELAERIAKGPIKFKLSVQLANAGDTVDDATTHWPEDRPVFDLAPIALTEPVAGNEHEQKHIHLRSIPRVDGIDPSNDPLLELRAAVYLLSGRRRRAAANSRSAMQKKSWKTRLIHSDVHPPEGFRSLSTPTYRGSTVLFPNASAVQDAWDQHAAGYTYGLFGTPTTLELAMRICELENGFRTFITPGGQGAIALINFAFLKSGDHVLVPESIYKPNRENSADPRCCGGSELP